MQDLNIHLFINPSCELIATDNTVYHNLRYGDSDDFLDDLSKHISIEFLTNSDNNVESSTIDFRDACGHKRGYLLDGNHSVFHFPKDGTFVYYKFLVPTIDHLLKEIDDDKKEYKTSNQLFYYNKKFYYTKRDFDGNTEVDEILRYCIQVNLDELWTYQGTQTFSFQKILFSVCKLQKCLVNLQKQILESSGGCNECDLDSSLRFKRDFLLSALYVFDYLKDRHNFEEAQRILDQMSDCSGTLCGDNRDKSDCGCGGVKF